MISSMKAYHKQMCRENDGIYVVSHVGVRRQQGFSIIHDDFLASLIKRVDDFNRNYYYKLISSDYI